MNSSILYINDQNYTEYDMQTTVHDLKMDEVIQAITPTQSIAKLYYQKPANLDDVLFRISCMKDLQRGEIRNIIVNFIERYEKYHEHLEFSHALSQPQTKQKWFLDAAAAYCESLQYLKHGLSSANIRSQALLRLLHLLADYMETPEFITLDNHCKNCSHIIDAIRYKAEVCLNQNKVKVFADDNCVSDYLEKLSITFQQYDLDPRTAVVPFPGVNMGTLELCILEQLNEIFPDAFHELDNFCRRFDTIGSPLVDQFVQELQFYLSYINYMDRLEVLGYQFSYPIYSEERTVRIEQGFDLAFAQSGTVLSPNDFCRADGQSYVITGPNQGGKTTYVRMIGQILYMASLGLPAPCKSIRTYFLNGLFTHFARDEDLSKNSGRLKEELLRIKSFLNRVSQDTVVIFNDVFSSTTTSDALQMGRQLLIRFMERGCLCLFVTHIHEFTHACPGIMSLRVSKQEEAGRYSVKPESQGSNAYGNYWLDRYHLHYAEIKERVL